MHSPKFAPVAPLPVLRKMTELGRDVVGDYHLLLAHDVLANETSWASWSQDLFTLQRVAGLADPIIIMDSSVIELGEPLDTASVIRAANVVNANVICLPDVIGDSAATKAFIRDFQNQMKTCDDAMELHNLTKLEYMFVPQGGRFEEYIDSIEFIADFDFIQWIGLPRDALALGVRSRRDLIDAVNLICPNKKIHLLGFSDNLMDDVLSARHAPNVMGIDSAVPIRAGLNHIRLKLSKGDYGKRGDYWSRGDLTRTALENLRYFRELLSR